MGDRLARALNELPCVLKPEGARPPACFCPGFPKIGESAEDINQMVMEEALGHIFFSNWSTSISIPEK